MNNLTENNKMKNLESKSNHQLLEILVNIKVNNWIVSGDRKEFDRKSLINSLYNGLKILSTKGTLIESIKNITIL